MFYGIIVVLFLCRRDTLFIREINLSDIRTIRQCHGNTVAIVASKWRVMQAIVSGAAAPTVAEATIRWRTPCLRI